VALNSLTSPGMVAATLSCLARGGRLAEISKRDIWSPARVAQERPDLRYQLVAIDFLPVEVIQRLHTSNVCNIGLSRMPVTLADVVAISAAAAGTSREMSEVKVFKSRACWRLSCRLM